MTALSIAYAVLTVAILVGSPINTIDAFWYRQNFAPNSSPLQIFTSAWVFLGRRAPATVIGVVYVVYRTYATRSWKPWVLFTLAWLGFNASVGAMKLLTGRIGPVASPDAYAVLAGGDIFPSGHVTGAVVIYGVMAMIAPPVHRRFMTALAIVMPVTVGFGTIAINTHWFSDVLGGWLDGGIVLLLAWAMAPWATRLVRTWSVRLVPSVYRYMPVLLPWRSVPTAWRSRSRSTR